VYPRDVVCFRYTIVNTVHTGDNGDNDDITMILAIIDFNHTSRHVPANKSPIAQTVCDRSSFPTSYVRMTVIESIIIVIIMQFNLSFIKVLL